ncbi:Chromosomal replication initiator protein DnaA [Rhodanobacter lindaniclasticus]
MPELEQFVGSIIEALRAKSMDEFRCRFRSVDALLIDDIQFFAGKHTTQEELLHAFNALFESKQQIILTYPLPQGSGQQAGAAAEVADGPGFSGW